MVFDAGVITDKIQKVHVICFIYSTAEVPYFHCKDILLFSLYGYLKISVSKYNYHLFPVQAVFLLLVGGLFNMCVWRLLHANVPVFIFNQIKFRSPWPGVLTHWRLWLWPYKTLLPWCQKENLQCWAAGKIGTGNARLISRPSLYMHPLSNWNRLCKESLLHPAELPLRLCLLLSCWCVIGGFAQQHSGALFFAVWVMLKWPVCT